MNKLNSKELKNKIENLYPEILQSRYPHNIVVLDAVKSIMGIDLNNIDSKLLDIFMDSGLFLNDNYIDLKDYKAIPEAISMYGLEKSLLDRNHSGALEHVFYLSRVSDGIQILEFLLEFSLQYCSSSYSYIWHIIRMQKFLNGKFMIESLNKSIDLILGEDFINPIKPNNKPISWPDYLSLNFNEEHNILLYYTIYKTDLIRCDAIRCLIRERLFLSLDKAVSISNNNINLDEEQFKLGRKWIFDYIMKIDNHKIDFEMIVFFDGIRSCLMLSDSRIEKEYIWSYLNNRICN